VAEKLIFGAQKISRGAGHDIETATKLATSAIKEYGMGSIFADLNIPTVHTRDSLHDLTGEYNNEVKMLLNKGAELAEMILLQEKKLLLQLADYLSEERIIKKKEIEEKVRTYGSEAIKNISFIENGDHLFYRAKLKKEVSAVIDEAPINLIGAGMGSISLNKNE
jgi:ATP-dependent Zn protease